MSIQAWQHIYSNVEKEQSPQRRGGFQTLFYSHNGLSEAEVEEMEGRLLYFPSKVEPVKRLFFSTSTGKGVVSQIVFLPMPDQFGRGGRYLAHSLVFAPEALPQFEADPFRVFRQFSFVSTVDEALKLGNFQTGHIPPVALNLPQKDTIDVEAAGNWSPQELKKLTLLALRVERQAQEREAITITGQPAEIENALAAAFLAVPISMRPGCSFDSYFYRCNLVATYFWAIGLPEPPVSVKFAHVDGQKRQVTGQGAPDMPASAYERWAAQAIEAGKLAHLAQTRDVAFALAEWLDDRAYNLSLLNAAPPEIIDEVFKASPQSVQASLQRVVAKKLPPQLVNRAVEYVFEQASGVALYKQLRQGFELWQLLEVLYRSYGAQNFREPARQEIKAMETLLEKANHNMLRLFLAYWDNPRKHLPRALQLANEADYRQFVQLAFQHQLVDPLLLVAPGKGDAFLDLYPAQKSDTLPELAEALLEAGEAACLERLSRQVFGQPRKALNKLRRLIESQPGIPEPFQQAVTQAIAKLPPEGGLKGMLRSVFDKLPGR